MRAVALEVEDGVDQVLEHARAGERALLGHVADEKAGDTARLRARDQQRRRLAHLSHAAGRGAEGAGVERLDRVRSEEHTSELQSLTNLVCRLLLEKKKKVRLIRLR